MAYKDCIEQIVRAAGRDLTGDELKIVERRVADIMGKLERNGQSAETVDIEATLSKEADEIKAAAQIAKRNRIINTQTQIKHTQYLERVWSDDMAGGLRSLIDGTFVDREGAKRSMQRAVSSEKDLRRSAFVSKLVKEDLLEASESGAFDEDIWRIQSMLSDEDITPAQLTEAKKEVPGEAFRLAEIYYEINEGTRLAANEAGAWIGKHNGYVTKRSHDMYSISHAAGKHMPVNSTEHRAAWKQDWLDAFDPRESFPEAKPERYSAILDSLFDQFASGEHLNFGNAHMGGQTGFANLGRKMSHARVFKSRGWKQEFAYHTKYSGSGSIGESIFEGLSVSGKDIGIMKHMGPNAKDNWEAIFKTMEKKVGGDTKQLKALRKEKARLDKKSWPVITGELGISTNESVSRWSERVRALQVMSDLGSAVLSSTNDINNNASLLNYYGDRTTGEFFQHTSNIAKSAVSDVPFSERINVAAEGGVLLDGVFSMALDMTDPTMPGSLHKVTELTMKFGGIRWLTNKMRSSSIVAHSMRQAQHANKSFDDLPAGMQAGLRQFEISPAEWDTIRKAPQSEMSTGQRTLTPENMDDIPDSFFPGDTSAAQRKARNKLQTKYRMLSHEIANSASTTPSLATKSLMLQGTHRGDFTGEMMRHGGLFKSYIVSYMREHLQRELYGYHPDRVGLPKAILRAFTTGDGLKSSGRGVAFLIAGGMFWGTVSNTLHDIAAGREPIIPTDLETTGKVLNSAMWRSGALGLYGDLLFGEVADHVSGAEFAFGLAGPSARRLGQVTDLWNDARRGDFEAAKAFRALYSLVPGRSLFYTKLATDYLVLYRISEMLNPGYLDRIEDSLEDRKNQQYFIPPSDVIE